MQAPPSRLAKVTARAGVFAALLCIVGPALAHFELVKPMAGFVALGLGALLAVLAVATGAVALLRRERTGSHLARRGIVPALAVLFTLAGRGWNYPRINDISTDFNAPPEFVTAQTLAENRGRDLRYPGASFAEQQRAGYPDLTPLSLDIQPNEAFTRVAAAARSMPGWTITREDAARGAIEGVDTTRLFRFQDDFVIEVREQDGRTVVHMRSKSRDG